MIEELDSQEKFDFLNQEVRSAIMDLLRVGIKEYDSINRCTIQRYVLSPKEIHQKINQDRKQKIKLSNVYFHIDKLKENNLIEIVAEIKIKRQIVNYYGRTAKLFLLIGSEKQTFDWLIDLFQSLNKKIDRNHLQKLNKEFQVSFRETDKERREWLEKNQNVLTQFNLDPRTIYKFLTILDSASEPVRKILVEYRKLLSYPKVERED